jgi:hypothetical protein
MAIGPTSAHSLSAAPIALGLGRIAERVRPTRLRSMPGQPRALAAMPEAPTARALPGQVAILEQLRSTRERDGAPFPPDHRILRPQSDTCWRRASIARKRPTSLKMRARPQTSTWPCHLTPILLVPPPVITGWRFRTVHQRRWRAPDPLRICPRLTSPRRSRGRWRIRSAAFAFVGIALLSLLYFHLCVPSSACPTPSSPPITRAALSIVGSQSIRCRKGVT